MEELSKQTYRELQATAKAHGIPANKKREVLLELLLEKIGAQDVSASEQLCHNESEIDTEINIVQNVEVATDVVVSMPLSTCEAIENNVATEIIASEMLVDHISPAKCENDSLIVQVVKGTHITFLSPDSASVIPQAMSIDEETVVISTDYQDYNVHWSYSDYEKDNQQSEDINDAGPSEVYAGKHTIFQSPELQMGSNVHWRYEDYDVESQSSTDAAIAIGIDNLCIDNIEDKENCANRKTPTKNARTFDLTPAKKFAADIAKASTPKEKKNEQIKFWLSKAPALTPSK